MKVANPKTGGESANLNLLPTAAIERVEILADGASAVYGSDAIGGVVNIITKKDFNGLTISGTVSSPDLPGGEESHSLLLVDYQLMIHDYVVLWAPTKRYHLSIR